MYPEPKELLLIGCQTELIWTPRIKSSMSTPNTNMQTHWHKGISHVMSGTIFSSVKHQPFQLTLLLSEFQLDLLHQNDGEKDARTARREQDRGKVKADDDEPGLTCRSSTVQNPVASKSPGIVKAPCRTDWSSTGKPDAKEHNQDAASSSQGWQKDAVLDVSTRKPVATEEDQEPLNYHEASVGTRKPVASGNSETEGSDEAWPHNLHISTNYVLHMEMVFSIVRDKDMVSAIHVKWKTSMWAQIHVAYLFLSLFKLQFIWVKITQEICDLPRISRRNLWNSYFKRLRGWSRIKQKLLDWPRLIGSSLCGERRLCWLTELFSLQLHVCEVSVLNQSKHGKARLNGLWKHVISKIWIESTGSRWSSSGKFPRIHHIGNSWRDPEDNDFWVEVWTRATHRKEHLHVNVQWHWLGKTRKQRKLYCEYSQSHWVCSKIHARRLVVSGAWFGEEMVRNPCQRTWWRMEKTADDMMLNFVESGHLVFRASSAVERGKFKRKGKGVKSIHFSGSDDTIELILRTVTSVNQLSVYGAVADL